jgi:hypothetical protein
MSFTDGAQFFLAGLFEEFAMMVAILICFASAAWYRRRSARVRLAKAIPAKSVWANHQKPTQKKVRSNLSTASTTDESDPAQMCDDSDTETAYSSKSRLSNRRAVSTQNRTQKFQTPGSLDPNLEKVLEKLDAKDVAVVRAMLASKEPSRNGNNSAARADHREQRPWQNRPARDDTENSLRTNLKKLAAIDTGRIMMVKKISKLGLNSPQILTDYFSKFGAVTEVYVTHAIDKRADRLKPRVRPASIGFIVMDTAEATSAALSLGTGQDINGVMIFVGTYENVSPKDAQQAQDDAQAEEDVNDDGQDLPEDAHGGEEHCVDNERIG